MATWLACQQLLTVGLFNERLDGILRRTMIGLLGNSLQTFELFNNRQYKFSLPTGIQETLSVSVQAKGIICIIVIFLVTLRAE